jgi:hypothetical protein
MVLFETGLLTMAWARSALHKLSLPWHAVLRPLSTPLSVCIPEYGRQD